MMMMVSWRTEKQWLLIMIDVVTQVERLIVVVDGVIVVHYLGLVVLAVIFKGVREDLIHVQLHEFVFFSLFLVKVSAVIDKKTVQANQLENSNLVN